MFICKEQQRIFISKSCLAELKYHHCTPPECNICCAGLLLLSFKFLALQALFNSYAFLMWYQGENVIANSVVWNGCPPPSLPTNTHNDVCICSNPYPQGLSPGLKKTALHGTNKLSKGCVFLGVPEDQHAFVLCCMVLQRGIYYVLNRKMCKKKKKKKVCLFQMQFFHFT